MECRRDSGPGDSACSKSRFMTWQVCQPVSSAWNRCLCPTRQVIGTLKTAFVHGQLPRTNSAPGRPGAHRTDLRLPCRAHRRHPTRAARSRAGAPARPGTPPAADQGGRRVGRLPDHRGRRHLGPLPPRSRRPLHSIGWAAKLLFLAFVAAVVAAPAILAYGVAASWELRRSRSQLPPGPGGHPLDGERRAARIVPLPDMKGHIRKRSKRLPDSTAAT